MKAIGEILGDVPRPRAGKTGRASGTPGSGAEGGGGEGDGGARRGGGEGRPGCPLCGGVGWLRRDVDLDHPDFGKAFPCECIAAELAERRLKSVRRASNIAALDQLLFESFDPEAPGNSPEQLRNLQSALTAARRFAEAPDGWLVLHGSYGCGKTHLAAAIVNERLRQGHSALFVVVPDLLDHLRAAFSPEAGETYDERFEAVRNAPLLVLDDLGTQAPTAWAAEKLFQILNHRYNMRLPTVITSNVPLDLLDARLRSRLEHFDVVRIFEIEAIDYRGGVAHSEGGAISSLRHYADLGFQTWEERRGELQPEVASNLARAFTLARRFAAEPEGWLVLLGDHGSGKTHLAAAIANERVADGGEAVFVVVPDLLDHLRATFSPTSRVGYDKVFDEVRSAPLLVLDDLGTESATPWAQEKLFQILNHRHAARLPTVITSAAEIADIHPRLRTRMLDRRRCVVFEILAPPYVGPASIGRAGGGGRGPGKGRASKGGRGKRASKGGGGRG